MTLKLTGAAKAEDGTIQVTFDWDDSDGAEGVVLTGPVDGMVTLNDGTIYDVSPPAINARPGHSARIAYQIAKKLEATGDLQRIVHGDSYDGDCVASVVGDEDTFDPTAPPAHSGTCHVTERPSSEG